MLQVSSFQIADSIDIKALKAFFTNKLLHSDADELFYSIGPDQFFYIFKFGIISFFNVSETQMGGYIHSLSPYSKNILQTPLSDDFAIEINAPRTRLGFNKIELTGIDANVLRLIMLNVSQSVALDHYSQLTNSLLEETNTQTQLLEHKGKLGVSGVRLKKYIGRTLNIKNRIMENLYIFDSPDETWEDEDLNKLDIGLKKTFDLQARFRTILEGLGIVKENLELFKDILQHRNSTRLEWVVILLILVEVLNLLVEKIAH
jgi:required for meiotic nuclear division protein 1